MRGEHPHVCRLLRRAPGSSPHARGTHRGSLADVVAAGIIPACAGNTSIATTKCASLRDHPRMRGEHEVELFVCGAHEGSSPHARGTLRRVACWLVALGIIPACAGNTATLVCSCFASGDHPRMRGEHFEGLACDGDDTGSSPHARGTRG